MAQARLMDRPEDFERFGVRPGPVEPWEDGRRIEDGERGWWEWWYFDAILDDGTNVVVQFFTKSGATMYLKSAHPNFTCRITLPDGTERAKERRYAARKATWSRERCDVNYDGNLFQGDLTDYHILVRPDDGTGVDLRLHSLSTPYRPGSSYIEFGAPDRLYTWLCVVPRGEVEGTITVDGQERQVRGFGYHDHQWGNVNFLKEWNHWVWARQSFEDRSITVFDMVSNERTGFTRFPFVFVQDAQGQLVFESTEGVACEVLGEYDDAASGKVYPTGVSYVFHDGEKTAEYAIRMESITENNGKNSMSLFKRTVTGIAGIDPSYTRYAATGTLALTEADGKRTERAGELIYEFMYPGATWKGHLQA